MRRLGPILAASMMVAVASALSLGCGGERNLTVLPPDVDADRLTIGEPFPDLVLPSLDGVPRAVSQFRGEKLILHIFASW